MARDDFKVEPVADENRVEIEAALDKLGVRHTPFAFPDDILDQLEEIFFAMFGCVFSYVIFDPASPTTSELMSRRPEQSGGGPAS
jgi:hypothetical protein